MSSYLATEVTFMAICQSGGRDRVVHTLLQTFSYHARFWDGHADFITYNEINRSDMSALEVYLYSLTFLPILINFRCNPLPVYATINLPSWTKLTWTQRALFRYYQVFHVTTRKHVHRLSIASVGESTPAKI